MQKTVFKTGSQIRILPPDLEDIDLWSVDTESLELLEPLEPTEEDLRKEEEANAEREEKIKSSKKENNSKYDEASELASQKSALHWVPVVEKAVQQQVVEEDDTLPDLAWQSSGDPNLIQEDPLSKAKVIVRDFIAAGKGISSLAKSRAKPSAEEMDPDFEQDVDDFLNNKDVETVADDDVADKISEDVLKATNEILADLETQFHSRLHNIHSRMKNKTAKEVAKLGQGLFDLEDEKPEPLPSYEENAKNREAEEEEGKHQDVRIDLCREQDPKQGGADFLALPNPNPNRLLLDDLSLSHENQDRLRQWLREVQENKEFIRDMEFFFEMSKKM